MVHNKEEALKNLQIAVDTIQIQNVMGEYVAPRQSPYFASDVLKLFDLEDPGVSIHVGGQRFVGKEAVSDYWHTLQKLNETNGGVLGQHHLTSPVIKIAEDGIHAEGMWQDLGVTLFGPGMGAIQPGSTKKYRAVREVSRYRVSFRKTNDGWKIKNMSWVILWTYPGEEIDEDQNWIADTSVSLPGFV